jgi:voltage-gated potassium channel
VLKVFRAIRLVKLLRIRRSSAYLASISHMVEVNPGIIRILKFFLVFLVLAHYLSCAMFFVGTLDYLDVYGNTVTWLTQTTIVDSEGNEIILALAPLAEQYLWTMYWTITTMTTVGFGDILPITESEVIMSIFTMIIGGGVFSFIVGNTASLLTRLDSKGAELEDLKERISDFMQANRIPFYLRDQCERWIEFQHNNSVHLPVELTQSLSDTLRAELYVFVNRGFLERTAVLRRHLPAKKTSTLTSDAMNEEHTDGRNQDERFLGMLMEKCREQHLCPGETIFIQGCRSVDMYFIEQGQVDITRLRPDGSSSCVLTTLYTGAVFGQDSFISKENERRTYTARSRTWSKLKVINTQNLKEIALLFPRLKAHFLQDLESFSQQFERSLQLSMLLDDRIGTNVSGSAALPSGIVSSILEAASLVKFWKDPEIVGNLVAFFFLLPNADMANQVFSGSSNSKAAEAASEQPPAANEVQQLVDSLSGILEEGSEERLAKSSVRKESLSLRSLLGGFYERIAALEETENERAQSFKEIRFFSHSQFHSFRPHPSCCWSGQ